MRGKKKKKMGDFAQSYAGMKEKGHLE